MSQRCFFSGLESGVRVFVGRPRAVVVGRFAGTLPGRSLLGPWPLVSRHLAVLVGILVFSRAQAQFGYSSPSVSIPEPLTLAHCFELTLAHNQSIRAARYQAGAEQARITAEEGAFDPSLVADANWRLRDQPQAVKPKDSVRTGEGAFGVGLTKRFVTGTDVELATAVDYTDDRDDVALYDPLVESGVGVVWRQDLLRNRGVGINRTGIMTAYDTYQIAVEHVRDQMIRNLVEVEGAYWSLYFAREDLKVRAQQLERANRLVAVARSQVRVGEAAPIEVTRAQSSAASQEVSILDARNRIAVLQHRLLSLLGVMEPDTAERIITLAEAPPAADDEITLEQSLNIAFSQRPDCRQAVLALGRAERLERFAENQILPSLKLYGAVRLAGLDERLDDSAADVGEAAFDSWEVGIRLDVPIGNRTARGNAQAASLERRRAAAWRRNVLQQATRQVADAVQDLRTARSRIQAAEEARHLAESLLAAEEKSFRLGRSDSLDVLNAQQALAAAEREVARARTAYATARSVLMAVRGDFLVQKNLAGVTADPATMPPEAE